MELGDGFAFVGEKVVQEGNQDFEVDLLFYHRDLQCLVAFELKTGRFGPEHMGKLSFYLKRSTGIASAHMKIPALASCSAASR